MEAQITYKNNASFLIFECKASVVFSCFLHFLSWFKSAKRHFDLFSCLDFENWQNRWIMDRIRRILFFNRLRSFFLPRWDSISFTVSQLENAFCCLATGKIERDRRAEILVRRISNANETAGPRANKSRVCKIWWHWPHDDARMHNHGARANFLKHTSSRRVASTCAP